MDPKTILLTGVSGFLGSHLGEELIAGGHTVIALIRNSTDLWRCRGFENNRLIYVNVDSQDLKKNVEKYRPSVLIHSAWEGVVGKERNDREMQNRNVEFAKRLLILSKEVGVKTAICLGSQAEYGHFKGRIDEEMPCKALSEYGKAKLEVLDMFKSFCEANAIKWFWIRLFSVYGTREGTTWLIPSVIRNILAGKPMDLTGCEQRYDYMYVKDFARAVSGLLETKGASGVYNLGSNTSIQLRNLVESIRDFIDPNAVLNFGALPYGENQVMHMEGDSGKFYRMFNFSINSQIAGNIEEVVNYYRNKFKEQEN